MASKKKKIQVPARFITKAPKVDRKKEAIARAITDMAVGQTMINIGKLRCDAAEKALSKVKETEVSNDRYTCKIRRGIKSPGFLEVKKVFVKLHGIDAWHTLEKLLPRNPGVKFEIKAKSRKVINEKERAVA